MLTNNLILSCHTAVGVSLIECLVTHNLTTFINYLTRSMYLDLLSMTDSNISLTIFAPTNAAFDAANIPTGMDPDMLVGNHIVLGTVKESDLVLNRQFMNLEGLRLHSTTAAFPDTSHVTSYNSQFISVRAHILIIDNRGADK